MNASLYLRVGILAALGAPAGCSPNPAPPSLAAPQSVAAAGVGAVSADAPLLPDRRLTPGAVFSVTVDQIRVPGYARSVRDVPPEVKRAVYAEYGITHHRPRAYEIDHLISLELGGSNSIRNLWPESYFTQPWNAHVKDDLENKLHDLVCDGQVPLATAQRDIAADWIAAYQKYFHTRLPLPNGYRRRRSRNEFFAPDSGAFSPVTPPEPGPAAATGGVGEQVWVNTRSGKYFRPGSEYYGRTKRGEYMTEAQASAQGYVAARGQ